MVKVVAENFIKAECVDEFLSLVKVLVEKTHALDAGCIKYEMNRDVNDPAHFIMLEEWENQASLDNHMKSAHFNELIPQMRAFGAKEGIITILDKAY